MKIELISVLALLFCLLIIGIEYIMHYRLAELQDEHTARIENISKRRTFLSNKSTKRSIPFRSTRKCLMRAMSTTRATPAAALRK